MSSTMKHTLLGAVIGSVLTFGIYNVLMPTGGESGSNTASAEKKPLYWVAPMDANYTRDKPGKSPMGMDLIPYYGNDGSGPDEGKGTIRISPDVVNNLGVRTVTAQYKALHTQIDTVGYVAYDEDRLVHIHPRVEGWIEKLYVKAIGDPVEKGQALYDIYSPQLVNAQEELLLALDRKNKRLITAAEDRLMALQIPTSAIKRLKKTRKVSQNITFYAPQKGVVENLKIREGFFVKPGATILSIGDLSEVWVEAEVFERQAAQVQVGTPLTMILDYLPGQIYQGKIDYVYPTLDAKTRTVKVRIRFNNANGEFKPNMFAQISIHTSADKSALLIPKEALIRTGNQDRVVLALGEGSFKSVEVKVGRFDSESVEILSGISEGEMVVSSAQFLLDSESSKTSDFKRMNHDDGVDEAAPTSVWVQANIISMMAGHKMLTLEHEAISAWGWPIMTMDFIANQDVDFSNLSEGLTVQVQIQKTDTGDYVVSAIELGEKQVSRATVMGTITALMADHGMITINRGAIDKWDRPAETVDFIADEGVNLTSLAVDMMVDFTFEIRDGNFIITEIKPMTDASNEESSDHSSH
ncbi:MAG: efflux RND transporter periplasmic adaptor subunit [Colwellia sp.]|nr:efflux RND transporter periplasmic adaptor subunit [Colwellia sp.]